MHVRVVTFRLNGITHEQYEDHCRRIAAAFNDWPGLLAKVWLADRATNTYGGVYLFDTVEAADRSRSTVIFESMASNPAFADLSVVEYPALASTTAVTGGPLAELAGAAS